MNDIYNNDVYLNSNPSWHEEDAPFKAEKISHLLNRNKLSINSVCDIGCGSGELLVQLSKKILANIEMTGLDISAAAINIATKKSTEKLKFYCKDISHNDHNAETFFYDLLLVIDVIEHIENYFAFLKSLVIKGKYTIFHIPLDISVWSLFREKMLVESKERVGHIHNFTELFIESILADCGFKIIDKIYTEPTFEIVSFKQKIINSIRVILYKINKPFCSKVMGGYSILVLCENDGLNKKY